MAAAERNPWRGEWHATAAGRQRTSAADVRTHASGHNSHTYTNNTKNQRRIRDMALTGSPYSMAKLRQAAETEQILRVFFSSSSYLNGKSL